jgi:extracellular elastinolytic metalloproteinase
MRIVRYFALVSASLLASITTGAAADEKIPAPDRTPVVAAAPCDLTGYTSHVFTAPGGTGIPIPDAAGVSPPLPTFSTVPDMTVFTDVIVGVKIDHTWVGDLIITIRYDQNNDMTPETLVKLLCRPDIACDPAAAGTGCSDDMACTQSYLFSDAGTMELATGQCGFGVIPGGCFVPTITGGGMLSAFDGLMKGGTFSLTVTDHVAQDVGLLCEWSVHYKSQGVTAAQGTTWGKLKVNHR